MSETAQVTIPVIRPEDFSPGALDGKTALTFDKKLGRLSLAERKLIVDQAILLLEENYAHLPMKRSMHAVNPVQLLKLLRLELDDVDPRDPPPEILFHQRVHAIFHTVRDLHTSYVLPKPFQYWEAFLPFTVGEYFERVEPAGDGAAEASADQDCLVGECEKDDDGLWAPRYVVTSLLEGFRPPAGFAPGARLLSWNGMPMARAVAVTADQFAGSNPEARRARGLARLTLRPFRHAMPSESLWVDLVYHPVDAAGAPSGEAPANLRVYWAFAPIAEPNRADGTGDRLRRELRQIVAAPPPSPSPAPAPSPRERADRVRDALREVIGASGAGNARNAAAVSIARRSGTPAPTPRGRGKRVRGALRGEVGARRVEHVPNVASVSLGLDEDSETVRVQSYHLYAPPKKDLVYSDFQLTPIGDAFCSVDEIPIVETFSVNSWAGHFGLLRIRSFNVEDIDAFVAHIASALERPELGRKGLVIDVRGNPGGFIPAGERILQLFSPRPIEPARFQFLNTALNLELCRRLPGQFGAWAESIASSVATGDAYSRALPLTPVEKCNDLGQRYAGPKLLITDARCYSTTDIFAAGFQDHGIGEILGVHGNTGAGGANNVKHSVLRRIVGGGPYKRLPQGAEFSVALRRSTRVLGWSGRPVEDLGVVPDHRHRLTRADVLGERQDLYKEAIRLLEVKAA